MQVKISNFIIIVMLKDILTHPSLRRFRDVKFWFIGQNETFSNILLLSGSSGVLHLNSQNGQINFVCPSSPQIGDPQRILVTKYSAKNERLGQFPYQQASPELFANGIEQRHEV
jgi:hypothetical protein